MVCQHTANGSLSCRKVYHDVSKLWDEFEYQNEGVKIFIDLLFKRDYYKFWFLNRGNAAFQSYGIYNRTYYNWQTDMALIERWKQGMTGMPMIDALMREMNETGFMPNRGRILIASYFTLDLKQDWRYGAHYFEQMLIDYEVQ